MCLFKYIKKTITKTATTTDRLIWLGSKRGQLLAPYLPGTPGVWGRKPASRHSQRADRVSYTMTRSTHGNPCQL